MPCYDEAIGPDGLVNGYSDPTAQKWADKIEESDGFIMITPAYNSGPPAVLKNALDYVYKFWNRKPVAFISYSAGPTAGVRAVEQLRTNAIKVQMAPIFVALHIAKIDSVI